MDLLKLEHVKKRKNIIATCFCHHLIVFQVLIIHLLFDHGCTIVINEDPCGFSELVGDNP